MGVLFFLNLIEATKIEWLLLLLTKLFWEWIWAFISHIRVILRLDFLEIREADVLQIVAQTLQLHVLLLALRWQRHWLHDQILITSLLQLLTGLHWAVTRLQQLVTLGFLLLILLLFIAWHEVIRNVLWIAMRLVRGVFIFIIRTLVCAKLILICFSSRLRRNNTLVRLCHLEREFNRYANGCVLSSTAENVAKQVVLLSWFSEVKVKLQSNLSADRNLIANFYPINYLEVGLDFIKLEMSVFGPFLRSRINYCYHLLKFLFVWLGLVASRVAHF